MLFNSTEFAFFLPVVFALYWILLNLSNNNKNLRNLYLLIVSYIFYGWWDWRFLLLIFISSVVDFTIGNLMYESQSESRKRILLALSLTVNLGILGFFKYFNFFIDSFVDLFSLWGVQMNQRSLNVILPVGISFYTFQTLSYSIDIYRKRLIPTKNPVTFFAFVSFFPQLVAGPIERAVHLIPQFEEIRPFNSKKAVDGCRQILWGLFKKIVIADTCATHVDYIFSNHETLGSGYLIVGAMLFAFQIYGDFSGYSDIAIGVAKLFNFDLMQNFAYPYFSRDIAEFWRRWHISLSTWFRDYVYIPLGGSYVGKLQRIRNIIITFTVSGFWHGANWTFIFWGFLNGLYYIPLMLANRQKKHTAVVAENRLLPSPLEIGQVLITFALTVLAWIFFRADSLGHAFEYIANIFAFSDFSVRSATLSPLKWIALMLLIEWFQRTKAHGLYIEKTPVVLRWAVYATFTLLIFKFFTVEKSFIYFQF